MPRLKKSPPPVLNDLGSTHGWIQCPNIHTCGCVKSALSATIVTSKTVTAEPRATTTSGLCIPTRVGMAGSRWYSLSESTPAQPDLRSYRAGQYVKHEFEDTPVRCEPRTPSCLSSRRLSRPGVGLKMTLTQPRSGSLGP